jgi:hypothetical protein
MGGMFAPQASELQDAAARFIAMLCAFARILPQLHVCA